MTIHPALAFVAGFSVPCVVVAGWWAYAVTSERWASRAWGRGE